LVFAFKRDETDILSFAKALVLVPKTRHARAGSLKALASVPANSSQALEFSPSSGRQMPDFGVLKLFFQNIHSQPCNLRRIGRAHSLNNNTKKKIQNNEIRRRKFRRRARWHALSNIGQQGCPTFLLLGIYNKLVKQLGSDRRVNQLELNRLTHLLCPSRNPNRSVALRTDRQHWKRRCALP